MHPHAKIYAARYDAEPILPPEAEKPKGGRPRNSDRAALAGIMLVLRTGMQRKHLPRSEVGCSG